MVGESAFSKAVSFCVFQHEDIHADCRFRLLRRQKTWPQRSTHARLPRGQMARAAVLALDVSMEQQLASTQTTSHPADTASASDPDLRPSPPWAYASLFPFACPTLIGFPRNRFHGRLQAVRPAAGPRRRREPPALPMPLCRPVAELVPPRSAASPSLTPALCYQPPEMPPCACGSSSPALPPTMTAH